VNRLIPVWDRALLAGFYTEKLVLALKPAAGYSTYYLFNMVSGSRTIYDIII
jgi:hypothetical protein